MRFLIPYPPTANTYWRKYNNRMVLSDKGRAYRQTAAAIAYAAGVRSTDRPVRLTVRAYLPDNSKRDIDNLLKATLDALKDVAYEDDQQVHDLHIIRCGVSRSNPRLEIELETLQP